MHLRLLILLCTLYCCATTRYPSYLMDTSPVKIITRYIPHYQTIEVDGAWSGWNIFSHDPDQTRDSYEHDIASVYYPLIGPYSSNDLDYVEYQASLMKLVGIDGVAIDVGIYSEAASNTVKILISQLKRYNMSALLIYHDSDQFYIEGIAREDRVTKVYEDLTKWLLLIKDVQIRIGSRPILCILSTSGTKITEPEEIPEDTPGVESTEPRLIPSELKAWLNTFTITVRPIIVGQLFDSRYNLVMDGMLEWPTPTDESTVTFENVETSRLNLIEEIENNMKHLTIAYHITTVWPGYDDSETTGWGTTAKYIAYEDGFTYKYMWESASNLSSPIVLIESWNDWWNGTAIEPSLEMKYNYLNITKNYTYAFKGLEPEVSIDIRVPELVLKFKKNPDPVIQEVGKAIAKLIEDKEYLAADILASYYADKLGIYEAEDVSYGSKLTGYFALVIMIILIAI